MDFVRKNWIFNIKKIFSIDFRDNMGGEANEERAQQIFEKSTKLEQQFGDLFTGKLII